LVFQDGQYSKRLPNRCESILGGLHHEYRLEKIAGMKDSKLPNVFLAEHKG